MRVKTYKKSSTHWKHGKHKGLLQAKLGVDRGQVERPKAEMHETVKDALGAPRGKRRR